MSESRYKSIGPGKVLRNLLIEFPSDPALMSAVRGFVGRVCRTAGFDKGDVHAIVLAVDEACTNIIKHSYGGDHSQPIRLRTDLLANGVSFELVDYGAKVDPGEVASRDLDDIRPGGLGVYFIRRIMDEVDFDVSNEQFTCLRLVKFLPGTEKSDECNR